MSRRNLLAAALSAAVVTTTLAASPAAAAPADAPNLNDFVLNNTSGDLQSRVDKLDAQLPKLGVQNILDQANRQGSTGSACTSPALDTMKEPTLRKFCFNAGDTDTTEWMPQGVTTVADAQEDQQWGTKQALLVSWYNKDTSPVKGVRVSFLDPATSKYQHVLLVYPYINSNGNPSYEAVTTPQAGNGGSVHAGGIVWYGNYLYLVDTARGIRVFDMRSIFDLKSATNGDTADQNQVGRQNNVYYGFGYRYVMPQVAGWSNPEGVVDHPADYKCLAGGRQRYSYVSLDRSTNPDTLLTGEYCGDQGDPNLNGRVARWNLDGATGLPSPDGDGIWRAKSALRLPKPRVQGATATDGRWYLSSTGGGTTGPGHFQAALPDKATGAGVLTVDGPDREVAIGVEDLSYWPGKNEVWTVTEHPGKRVLYSVPR
ncbi:hypothetical protein [Saccharopolyspora sp. NPDC050642]|uniref:hypothetical protein n=1 Tax=Saccharopolyspora sp. NPDC050642 TaxID=3157099 RepID=UPI0033CDC169